MNIPLKCPKCSEQLNLVPLEQGKNYSCANGHCFDVAKQGYVNLHLVEKKKSKEPGDDALMIKSRQAFLNKGYYDFLADELGLILDSCCDMESNYLIDIGCGEGFYLQKINRQNKFICAGVDISKHGVKLASGRNKSGVFAVASAFDLPFFDDQFNVALSVFSPLCPVETRRVVKPGGYVIMVGPGPAHLSQLAEQIYQKVQAHKGNFSTLDKHPGFSLESKKTFGRKIMVDQQYITNLLRMTPYYWSATAEQQKAIADLPRLETEIEFEIKLYRTT